MEGDYSLALGVLIGLLFTLCIIAIFAYTGAGRKKLSPTLGQLNNQIADTQKQLEGLRNQVWDYGNIEEAQSRRWRSTGLALASRTADVLQSCWIMRNDNKAARDTYEELMLRMRPVGIEEVAPKPGDRAEESAILKFKTRAGTPPFTVSRLITPGYILRNGTKGASGDGEVVLMPAVVDVSGSRISSIPGETGGEVQHG